MIKLSRGEKPPVLVSNEETWRDEYLKRKQGDTTVPAAALTRYAHPSVKEAVLRDSHGKCIYCESKPRAVYPGAVEHLLPKALDKFPEKVVDWDNLGFICHECNSCKSDHWDPEAPILDPYVDEPADHLLFFGPLVLTRDGSMRGQITVTKLELDRRSDLIERKAEHIRTLKSYVVSWKNADEGPYKRILEEQIRRYAEATAEYTATGRTLLDEEGFPY